MTDNHSGSEIEVSVLMECQAWDSCLPGVERLVREVCCEVLLSHMPGGATGSWEISVALADDEFVRKLNHDFRGIDKPTNILSFPAEEVSPEEAEGQLLGDLALALETIRSEAAAQEKTLEHHLRHLLVHGCLHLLGFDHENEQEADTMEALEVSILATMGVPNPYEVNV